MAPATWNAATTTIRRTALREVPPAVVYMVN